MSEIFVSIDIEADGPTPLRNSMLSLGAAAFDEDGALIATFYRAILPLPGAVQDPRTMREFWDKNPKAWAAVTTAQVPAEDAMRDFASWLKTLSGKPVAVCYPAGYDFTFVYMYSMHVLGMSPLGFAALDIKTYVAAMQKQRFARGKRDWPSRWFDKTLDHTHIAIDDAIEQGLSFLLMRAENLGRDLAEVHREFQASLSTTKKNTSA